MGAKFKNTVEAVGDHFLLMLTGMAIRQRLHTNDFADPVQWQFSALHLRCWDCSSVTNKVTRWTSWKHGFSVSWQAKSTGSFLLAHCSHTSKHSCFFFLGFYRLKSQTLRDGQLSKPQAQILASRV